MQLEMKVCLRQVQGNGTVVNLSDVVFIELPVKIEHPVDVYLQKSSYDLRKFKVKCPEELLSKCLFSCSSE
jgi:hypothetical protein